MSVLQVGLSQICDVADLEGEQFDAVVSLKAFHHIPKPQEMVSLLVFLSLLCFLENLFEAWRATHYRRFEARRVGEDRWIHRSHSPKYHRSVAEPPECHGFSEETMKQYLTTAGLKAEVVTVNVTHYLECLDQEEAKKRFEKLPPFEGRVDQVEISSLPPMVCLQGIYFEKDVFPFVVACGSL